MTMEISMKKMLVGALLFAGLFCDAKSKPYKVTVSNYMRDKKGQDVNLEVKFNGEFLHTTVLNSTWFNFANQPKSVHLKSTNKNIIGDLTLPINWDNRSKEKKIDVFIDSERNLRASFEPMTAQQTKHNQTGSKML